MVDTPDRIAFLKKTHLFHGLEDNEVQAIANVMEEVPVGNAGVIFAQDSKSEGCYMIYRGNVRIVRKQQKKEILLANLVANDYFGQMGLIAKRRRSGTVTATSDSTLLVLTRKDFESLFKKTPQLRLNLDVTVRSRQLARTLQFKWLRSDEVVYFLARKHRIVLYQKLVLPVLALTLPLAFLTAYFTLRRGSSSRLRAGCLCLRALVGSCGP